MSWDDGKHAKVKRVQLTFDEVIRSIEVEYDGTSLKSQRRGTAGTKSDGFTLSPDEYITEVNGYYKTVFSGDVITALTFKTNKKTYGTYGDKTRNYFSLTAPTNNQIAGFFGSSSNALNSIDAHFAAVPSPGSTGTNPGSGGTGINPGTGGTGSGNTGGSNAGSTGTNPGSGGTGINPGTGGTGSNPGGNTGGSNAGSTGINPGSGGAGSNPGGSSSNTGSNNNSSLEKVEPQGGKGGNQWDDGADHDGVMKIYVAAGGQGVEQIRFDYVKNGQSKEGPAHGVKGRSIISTIVISHPDEYLVSVKGCYDSSNIIQGIQFKTNIKTSDYFGYDDARPFSLEVKDKKIVGFHGFADTHLNSLGAYFAPISTSSSSLTPPPNKVEAQGGNFGETFDDGAFDHVRKVYIGQGDSCVAYVKFDYEKDGKQETREHGNMTLLGTEEFEVDSGDYITSMDVYVDKIVNYKSDIVTALAFKTFKGKTSHAFGITTENKYELKDGKGGKLAGFHGKASDVLYAIGAYFAPTTN